MAQITNITVSSGLQHLLKIALNNLAQGNLVLRAYTNSVTITEATTLANLTEATNYTPVTLTGATWSVAYADGKGVATYGATVSIDFTGNNTINGLYLTNAAGDVLVSAGSYTVAKSVEASDSISVNSLVVSLDN